MGISKEWSEKILEEPAIPEEKFILIKVGQHMGNNASCVEIAVIEKNTLCSFLNNWFQDISLFI